MEPHALLIAIVVGLLCNTCVFKKITTGD